MKERRSNHSRKSERGAPSRPQRACDVPGRAAWRRLPIAPRLPHVGGSPGKQRVAFPTSFPQRRGNEDLSRRRYRMAAIKPDLHASDSPERPSLRMQDCRKEWQPLAASLMTSPLLLKFTSLPKVMCGGASFKLILCQELKKLIRWNSIQ